MIGHMRALALCEVGKPDCSGTEFELLCRLVSGFLIMFPFSVNIVDFKCNMGIAH